jgi:aldose 1-epimerase
MRNSPPSGEQIELRAGDHRVVVTEVGAGLRSYEAGGRELLNGYGPEEMAGAGRGQVLMPWPNRIEDGAYEFAGTRHELPLSEREAGNAIHGLVRWVAWSVGARDERSVVMEYVLHPQPGYPFALALAVEYAVSEGGLRVSAGATNIGSAPCPYGSGAHPYLTLGTATVDTLILRAPGATVLRTDARGIPVGSSPVDGTEFDFREARAIGATRLDHAFTDLERGEDGLARVELRDPHGGTGVTLWLGDAYPYVQLFTGDPIPDVNRRGIAVEPMTCPPNAFRSGEAVVVLGPGETTTATWGILPDSLDARVPEVASSGYERGLERR